MENHHFLNLGTLKIIDFQWFFKVFLVFVICYINADLRWILVPTWLHCGAVWAPKTRLGSVLGHLGGVLERLGASWAPLGRVLTPSWRRLGLQNPPT